MNLLVAENITKTYANHIALNDVSLEVPEQSIFGLLGPNGAGKTSLIRIINMITAPDSGKITINNEPLIAAHKDIIGYLPEERGLYKKMKVGEQAVYLAQLKGVPKAVAVKKLRDWFDRLDMNNWWGRKVEELSKGMQQKIQFVVTVLHEPKLLIFDEPFSGFDPINANIIKEEILRLQSQGATIIFSTHNMSSVEELCDHISLINKSNVILKGKVKDIRNKFKTNVYQVELTGHSCCIRENLNSRFEILDEVCNEGVVNARIKVPEDKTTNDMIAALMPLGNVHYVNEIVPTMNDIFIATVNNDVPGTSKSSNLTE